MKPPTHHRRLALIVAASAVLAAFSPAAAQQSPDSVTTREISPGVTLVRVVKPDGPVVLHVLELDLRDRTLALGAARACDRYTGRERPSAIARRLRASGVDVVAAINAGFFDLEGGTGISSSNVVIDGEIVKGAEGTDSPSARGPNVRSQFGMTDRGRPVIDRLRLTGVVRTPKGRWPLGAVNAEPVADEMSIYTEWSDRRPRVLAAVRTASVPLVRTGMRGDTISYRVSDRLDAAAPAIAAGADTSAALLVGSGRAATAVAALRAGERVTAVEAFRPARGKLRTVVGGWPRIVRDGVNIAPFADSLEGTGPGFSAARHPRSAVGISRDSATLYLAAVDGRQKWSVGMTLDELARAMIALGAYDVLNLDGGGSTALVVGDSVVNSPSDPGGERAVGDVLLVTREKAGDTHRKRNQPAANSIPGCVLSRVRDPDTLPAPAAPRP